MGGPRVTRKTENFLIQTWMSLTTPERGAPTAKEVLSAAQTIIDTRAIKDIFLPKLRKVQQILSQANENERELPTEQKLMKEPWSTATLKDYPLPPESLPAVMYVWRYTLITGEKFTIRQAKWVSRLWAFRPDPIIPDGALWLWLTAYEYAKKEEATLVSKRPFDTFQDDLGLVFSSIEAVTISKIMYGEKPFSDPFVTSIPHSDDGGILHEVLHPLDYYNALYNKTISNDRDKELHFLLAKMPSLKSLGLISLEIEIEYLIWVTHIKQRPEWPKISAKQASHVVHKLREWALKLQSVKYSPEGPPQQIVLAKIEDKKVFIDAQFPVPEEVLKLLSQYAEKGGTK